ncbi:hypothetical protein MPER_01983 [Moniliophthora perniciosa FA553]|nr:hypothetical protein MPER_01983 [Moniliophthora perniciosa FA553]
MDLDILKGLKLDDKGRDGAPPVTTAPSSSDAKHEHFIDKLSSAFSGERETPPPPAVAQPPPEPESKHHNLFDKISHAIGGETQPVVQPPPPPLAAPKHESLFDKAASVFGGEHMSSSLLPLLLL